MIATLLTHRSPRSTLIYTHPTADGPAPRARRARRAGPRRRSADMSATGASAPRRRTPRAAGRRSGHATSGTSASCRTAISRATSAASVILRFDGLAQPWLKEAAKRWARARLLASTAPQSMKGYLSELRAFSRWLARVRAAAARRPRSRRELLDRLRPVRAHQRRWRQSTQQRRLGALRAFFAEQRDDGLTGLPRERGHPRRRDPNVDYRLPRQLEPGIVRAVHRPANLALLASEQHRTIVLLLATTGLRVSSVAHARARRARDRLRPPPLPALPQPQAPPRSGAPDRPRARRATRPPAAAPDRRPTDPTAPTGCCPPRPSAARRGRQAHARLAPLDRRLLVKSYVRKADIRDRDGQLASWVHPHLFRHHLATSLVNDGVSLPVIQKLLDHASIEMTARYAHLHDDTLRDAITRWHERINIRGERIALPTNGPLEEAAWMKDRIAHARQALPNGYCGLPLVQTCPHPNACLSCDNFLTDGSFRPVHDQAAPAHPDHARRRPRTRRPAPRRNARTRRAEPDAHSRRPRRPRRDHAEPQHST